MSYNHPLPAKKHAHAPSTEQGRGNKYEMPLGQCTAGELHTLALSDKRKTESGAKIYGVHNIRS